MIKVAYYIKVYGQVLRNIIHKNEAVLEFGCHIINLTKIMGDLSKYR